MPYLGFTYIGALPATGNVPKLIMAVAATREPRSQSRDAAGCSPESSAAIAPLDWQMGIFACVGVFVAALMDEEPRARRNAYSHRREFPVAILFILYFVVNGALEPLLSQAITASLVRGATSTNGSLTEISEIVTRLSWHAPSEGWLIATSLVGMVIVPIWLAGSKMRSARGPLWVMAIYHFGIVGFSIFDFQGGGDTMLLLHSLAFFAGVALITACGAIDRLSLSKARLDAGRLAWLVLVIVLTRPAIAEPEEQFTSRCAGRSHALRPDAIRPPSRATPARQAIAHTRSHGGIDARRLRSRIDLHLLEPRRGLRIPAPTRSSLREPPWPHSSNSTIPTSSISNRFFAPPEGVSYSDVYTGEPGGYAIRVLVKKLRAN